MSASTIGLEDIPKSSEIAAAIPPRIDKNSKTDDGDEIIPDSPLMDSPSDIRRKMPVLVHKLANMAQIEIPCPLHHYQIT